MRNAYTLYPVRLCVRVLYYLNRFRTLAKAKREMGDIGERIYAEVVLSVAAHIVLEVKWRISLSMIKSLTLLILTAN